MASKYEQIAASLINDILNGRYDVGERLPSERDLAARFDANRGSVREAMKKLEQIGLADVQPGGARVKGKNEASLDVIGHMLSQGDLPDALLVDQILVVLNSLTAIAAEQVVELASTDEMGNLRKLVKSLADGRLDEEAHTLARIELMSTIMQTSNNLPLNLIARTLFQQFAPNMSKLHGYATIDRAAYSNFAKNLDVALEHRDVRGVRESFTAFSKLNRETMMRAFADARSRFHAQEASQ